MARMIARAWPAIEPAATPSPGSLRSPPSPAVRERGLEQRCGLMPDRSFLDWPFFDDGHRRLAASLETWAAGELGAIDHHDVDAACRGLVARLAAGGWLDHVVPASAGGAHERLDVRTLCL